MFSSSIRPVQLQFIDYSPVNGFATLFEP